MALRWFSVSDGVDVPIRPDGLRAVGVRRWFGPRRSVLAHGPCEFLNK